MMSNGGEDSEQIGAGVVVYSAGNALALSGVRAGADIQAVAGDAVAG